MSAVCSSCKQKIVNGANQKNALTKKICASCQGTFCSNCLYQRVPVPKLGYQMHEVCTPCFHAISTEMMLQKMPKNFVQRLEQQQPARMPAAEQLDPETRALDERLKQLRMDFPSTPAGGAAAAASNSFPLSTTNNDPDELLRQMNDELALDRNANVQAKQHQQSLEDRLRNLHETLPAATPNTVTLPTTTKQNDDNDEEEEEEFPWCTVCNENATKRCPECDELFCEACAKKIHRESAYKKHKLESYKPSNKAKKKYNY